MENSITSWLWTVQWFKTFQNLNILDHSWTFTFWTIPEYLHFRFFPDILFKLSFISELYIPDHSQTSIYGPFQSFLNLNHSQTVRLMTSLHLWPFHNIYMLGHSRTLNSHPLQIFNFGPSLNFLIAYHSRIFTLWTIQEFVQLLSIQVFLHSWPFKNCYIWPIYNSYILKYFWFL